jgi:mono/diheme cytochrome c family protein
VLSGYGGGFALGAAAGQPTPRPNGRVLVFRLGGTATLPEFSMTTAAVHAPTERFSDDQVSDGRLLYTQNCYRCHGAGAQSAGVLPDLRRSGALADHAAWSAIVNDGALESQGMVGFKRWLTPVQIEDIRAYIALKAKIAADHDESVPQAATPANK